MTAADGAHTLTIHLLAPQRKTNGIGEQSSSTAPLPATAVAWHRYTAAEVLAFVRTVGDRNPVHRTAVPIIPGMQLLCDLAARCPATNYDLRMCAPVFAEQTVHIERRGDRIEGYTDEAHVFTLTTSSQKGSIIDAIEHS